MSDPLVAAWKQRGSVFCWQYRDNRRNYPGWNFSADARGCASTLGLLELMLASRFSSQATISIASPTAQALRAVNGPDRWSSASELVIRHARSQVEAGYWRLKSNGGRIVITLGDARLKEFRSGVIDVSQGRGDWAAPNKDERIADAQLLCFWPLVWRQARRV